MEGIARHGRLVGVNDKSLQLEPYDCLRKVNDPPETMDHALVGSALNDAISTLGESVYVAVVNGKAMRIVLDQDGED
jgi:hypothetical protein